MTIGGSEFQSIEEQVEADALQLLRIGKHAAEILIHMCMQMDALVFRDTADGIGETIDEICLLYTSRCV